MICSRLCFPQLRNQWWLTLHRLLRVGLIVGAFASHVNGLECYDCKNAASPSFPPAVIANFVPPGAVNADCIDPTKASNLQKKTCNPNESCMKGYATGDATVAFLGGKAIKVELLVRQCYLHSSGQSVADTCHDYTGKAFGSNFTINWGADGRSLPMVFPETLQALHKAVASEAKAKQSQIPDLDITGTYCLCNTNDLCNDAAGMTVVNTGGNGTGNTNTTTTASTGTTTTTTLANPTGDRSPIQKAQPQQLIISLMVSIIILPSSVPSIS